MDLKGLIDLIRHFDEHLLRITHDYGTLTYAILFGIIFAETGLVILPFLPGDSLLFAAGALSAVKGSGLNVWFVSLLLFVAAVLGDTVNYHIGQFFGHKLFANPNSKIFKQEYLAKTHAFFEQYGGKAIIMARFVPIVRTFAPFVAGMGAMNYTQFFFYNVVGGALWVVVCVGAGFFFGNMPILKERFDLVVIGIVLVSVIPMAIEILNHRRRKSAISSASATSVTPAPEQ